MNLVTRFLAARRDKLLMKLGCWLVCFSLVLGLMLPQQRAEAVGTLTIAAVASVAAAYLGACGLTFVTQGMDKDALVSTTQRLIQEFLDTELGGITIQEWLGSVWNVAVLAGKLIMGRPLTNEFVSFAQWVAGKYGTQAGENVVYSSDKYSSRLRDGTNVVFSSRIGFLPGSFLSLTFLSNSTQFSFDTIYEFDNGFSFGLYKVGSRLCQKSKMPGVTNFDSSYKSPNTSAFLSADCYYMARASDFCVSAFVVVDSGYASYDSQVNSACFEYTGVISSLSIDRAPSMSYIPEGIKEGEGVALDVGAEKTMDLDQVLGGVLDDVLAGTLESTMAAADEKTEPVDPPAEELPDVGELGLPALGAALTSRFPFSIPWDFFRAVQLLAAPAKAPYFEVDFMEPLADDVGGWQGDTTVVLDFSEYAIIGQISRWTSTIGFCLMLAGATKRLIWTA